MFNKRPQRVRVPLSGVRNISSTSLEIFTLTSGVPSIGRGAEVKPNKCIKYARTARPSEMYSDVDRLVDRVRAEFGSIAFPSHCGLRAAVAMDDWISDPDELRRITAEQDVKGEWWEIPESELTNLSLASSYLDAAGTQFYLPALLVTVLRMRKHYRVLVRWLSPMENEPDCALYDYFVAKFAALTEGQRRVSIDVLRCVGSQNDPTDPWIKDEIEALLTHEYWRNSANV